MPDPLGRNGQVQPVEGVPSGIPIPVIITAEPQVQNIETVAPLGAGGTFNGAARDCLSYESFGISVYCDPAAGKAVSATVTVANSSDGGATWRTVDTILLTAAINTTVQLNRVYSVCRQNYRVSITNTGADAQDATEVVSMLKPV